MPEKIDRTNVGEAFQELTKYHRNYMAPHIADKEREPQYKEYQDVKQYPLPSPSTKNMTPAFDAIIHRRSIRKYTTEDIKAHHISKILWACQGVTAKVKGAELRATASAGALHPIETYIYVNRLQDYPKGLYHYNVRAHALDLLNQEDLGLGLVNSCLGQEFIGEASLVVLWVGVFSRTTWRFSERGYRYVYLECGQIAQNASIACQAMDLGCCPIAAFYDDELNLLLGLDGQSESVLMGMTIGMAKSNDMPISPEKIQAKVKIEKISE